MHITIRLETGADYDSIRQVNRNAFGQDAEANLVDALREQGFAQLGFSAETAARLQSEYAGEAFMALELADGALDGVTGEVKYAPPFGGV